MLTDSFVLTVEKMFTDYERRQYLHGLSVEFLFFKLFQNFFFLYQNFENVVFYPIFLNSNNIGIKKNSTLDYR
jgi:hypothetical protein